MRYALTSLANLLILVVGIAIGLEISPRFDRPAREVAAQTQASPSATAATTENPEQIQPSITAGTMGAYLLLAHHVQSDELVVNGIDILKLQQGELNMLARIPGVYPWQIQSIVDDARKTHLYQIASPKPPAATTAPNK